MRRIGAIIMVALAAATVNAQGREEFNGPFPGWANIKTRFGAHGNGKDDDTRAIQIAIDSLSCRPTGFNMEKGAYVVVYLPAGTYCVSSTLVMRGKIGVSLIGEDPARTIIKWTGGDKDTVLWTNGSAYFKIGRLTWDANGHKDMEGIGIHWKNTWNDGKTRSFAPLNIELSDNRFIGGFRTGISGGTGDNGTGNNDSEITIRRCVFDHCTSAGIEIYGYNALDYWIWDCRFLKCYKGVRCSFGGYHVYRSFFSGSVRCDFHNTNGYYNSVRGCYSENARAYSLDDGVSANPFKRIFQDNTVIGPHEMPIEYYHAGKITLMGNRFTKTVDTTYKFTVNTMSWAKVNYEVLSLHNAYGYKEPIHITSTPARIFTYGDNDQAVVTPAAAAFLKTMDPTPAKVIRKVFEVPAGSGPGAIQAIIDQAARLKGQRPVVYFGMGIYDLNKPLIIPANSDLQLAGDGLIYASVMRKAPAGFAGNALIIVQGPSSVNIQDLQLGNEGDAGRSAGVLFKGVDQPGAEAHLDQLYSHADTSLYAGSLNYLYIQKENSFFSDGNYVSGGPLVQRPGGTARVNCFGGQFVRTSVGRGGRFLAKDCWWEGENRIPVDLEGAGTVCIDGAMIAPNRADSSAAIRIGKFDGHICLMDMYAQGGLKVEPNNPGLNLLVWNIHFYYKMDVLDFLRRAADYKGAFLGLNAQCFRANDPACKDVISIPDRLVNVSDANVFLDSETAVDRNSRPALFRSLPAGVSNVRVSRVSLGSMPRGIVFSAN